MSPVQILPKAKTRKSSQIKEPENDKWNNRQCFDLSLHMPNKYTRKTETWGQADPHVIKLSRPTWKSEKDWR